MKEAPTFEIRESSFYRFKNYIDNLKIIASCTPMQRFKLVQTLKKFKKVTCISGSNIGESFCMMEADVALTMLKCGSDSVKIISDIIVDDDVHNIVDAMKFGRNIYENIRKFLQF